MQFSAFRLSRKIILLTLSLVIGASLILGGASLLGFYKFARDFALVQNQNVAKVLAGEVQYFMTFALETGEGMANSPWIREADPAKRQVNLAHLYKSAGVFDGISVTNRSGIVENFYPGNKTLIGQDFSDRVYVKNVLRTGRQFVTEPYLAKTGNMVVAVASPIKDDKGKVTGVITGSINLLTNKTLSKLVESAVIDKTISGYVITRSGGLVYHPDTRRLLAQRIDDLVISNIKSEPKFSNNYLDTEGNQLLVGYAPIKQLGWGVVIQVPVKQALKAGIELRNKIILILFISAVIIFLLSVWQARKISAPLQSLAEGVEQVAAGNFSVTVDESSQDETGVLARAFNSMVEHIETMQSDILNQQRELRLKNEELLVMAITDGLTKLYNYRYFQDCLTQGVAMAKHEQQSVALLIIDIDHFKHYNDLFGHQAGDQLLYELGQLLITELGPNDMVARYGGEEFTVILYGASDEEAIKMAEKIRRAVEQYPFPGREQQPAGTLTVSIGVATYPENAKNKEELIKLADEALYKAKYFSRNKVELYFSVLDELKSDLNQSEAELINSIKMLVRIVNAKDKYTYGHSERVGKYAVAIAEKMGLPAEDIKTIKIGAFLHDIGKIEVSRAILMKRGRLTDEEFDLIKKHPHWGAEMIKTVDALQPVIPLLRHHHERYDGKGYPTGLKGIKIPLHARIMAVADSFDAMTSNRPYGTRKNVKEAIDELKNFAGTQFDPEIVNVFVGLMENNAEQVS